MPIEKWYQKFFFKSVNNKFNVKSYPLDFSVSGGDAPFNTLFASQPLGHYATSHGSSYTKNEYNLFYQKFDTEYFFI